MAQHSPPASSACPLPKGLQEHGSTRGKVRPMTLDAFVEAVYLPHARQYKKSWAVDERIARQYLSSSFGRLCPADISRKAVETWLQTLPAQGLAPATCNRILYVFKSICTLAVRYELIPSGLSPCAGVTAFKIRTLRERYLTDQQAQRLMDALDRSPRQEAKAIKLLLLTGARKNEILKAQWGHIQCEQRLLTVPEAKSGKPRHIPLSDEALAVIQSIPRVPGCPWLFPGRSAGKPLADIYQFWNTLRRTLGLHDIRIHDLRHTFASMLVNTGHTLYAVQRLLGHSDPRTTMRYSHLWQTTLLAAAQSVGSRLARPRLDAQTSPQTWPTHGSRTGSSRASP